MTGLAGASGKPVATEMSDVDESEMNERTGDGGLTKGVRAMD